MGKHSPSYRKHPVLFISLFLLIIAAVSAAFLIPFIAEKQYWKDSHLDNAILNLSTYSERITKNNDSLDKIKSTVHQCNEAAIPVRPECTSFFDACNQIIISYFKDIYEIDITDKMNALQIMESVYPENISEMVGGSYSGDFPEKLFINAAVLDDFLLDMESTEYSGITNTAFTAKMLRTVYIHEVMHYLGFNSDTGFDRFMEAVAESLNKEAMLHSNIKYESITGYASIQGFAAQIAKCDPAFIRNVLLENGVHMDIYFNGKFGNVSDFNYAEYYDRLIGLIQKGDTKDRNKLKYYTQYLTYEYCKAVNSNAKDILHTNKENVVRMFEIKWLFGMG